MSKTNHQLINQTSGNTEWYTPRNIIEAVREVFDGIIHLDPASTYEANKRIRARVYYIKGDNALDRRWYGNVWLNHPFGRVSSPLWMSHLVEEFDSGRVEQALNITYASLETSWFRNLWRFPMWVPPHRINYIDPATGLPAKPGATKTSVVTYLGNDWMKFDEIFRERLGGTVYLPSRYPVMKRS